MADLAPMAVVVDASAVVDLLVNGSPLPESAAMASPAHLDAEVLSALGRLHRDGTLTAFDVEEMLDDLGTLGVVRVAPQRCAARRAVRRPGPVVECLVEDDRLPPGAYMCGSETVLGLRPRHLMARQATFAPHCVNSCLEVVDLCGFNAHLRQRANAEGLDSQPMSLIIGMPHINQADWMFDFPAGRWTLGLPCAE